MNEHTTPENDPQNTYSSENTLPDLDASEYAALASADNVHAAAEQYGITVEDGGRAQILVDGQPRTIVTSEGDFGTTVSDGIEQHLTPGDKFTKRMELGRDAVTAAVGESGLITRAPWSTGEPRPVEHGRRVVDVPMPPDPTRVIGWDPKAAEAMQAYADHLRRTPSSSDEAEK